jgi:hypothetical protein
VSSRRQSAIATSQHHSECRGDKDKANDRRQPEMPGTVNPARPRRRRPDTEVDHGDHRSTVPARRGMSTTSVGRDPHTRQLPDIRCAGDPGSAAWNSDSRPSASLSPVPVLNRDGITCEAATRGYGQFSRWKWARQSGGERDELAWKPGLPRYTALVSGGWPASSSTGPVTDPTAI